MKRNITLDAGRAVLLHDADAKRRRSGRGVRARRVERAQAPKLYQPVSTPTGPSGAQPADRRDPPGGVHRPPRAGLGQLHQRHAGVRRHAAGQTRRSASRRVSSFAWDVTGDGKTAIRGGAGIFYDRYSDDIILDLIELPPVLNTYRTNYTTIGELLAPPLTSTPTDARRDRPVHSAGRLQLEPRRAARCRVQSHRRCRVRRQRGTQSAAARRHQWPAVRLCLSAVEPRIRRTRRADRRSRFRTTSSGLIRAWDESSSGSSSAIATITRCSSP